MKNKLKRETTLQNKNLNFNLKIKRGILFLKNVPSKINFKIIKNIFGKFGFISRVFFIRQTKNVIKFKIQKSHKLWVWIEYLNKKDAKQATSYIKKFLLNSQLLPNISIAYLRSFSWEELSSFFY